MLTARDRVRQAEGVMAELHAALQEVGITLPSLCVDPVSCASSVMAPLVELGRCNLDTAQRLTDVLVDYAKTAAPGHGPKEGRP
ncbi:hypothetical protein AB0G60_19890 [Streptomyces angustmyceticus]|uniref:hypothetical protein n=1 Tax=Streptomyces angustmyceticus TaxID=285578 RepID=UPI001260BABC|nr:hypothetical protein [Streptomyces angustmyceticus]UAL67651.1 hypothetical protein K7396_14870 [Streptomyces angustmyceticus]